MGAILRDPDNKRWDSFGTEKHCIMEEQSILINQRHVIQTAKQPSHSSIENPKIARVHSYLRNPAA